MDADGGLFGAPQAVSVGATHAERVVSGRQVAVSSHVFAHFRVLPVVVEALKHVGKARLLVVARHHRGEFQGQFALRRLQGDGRGIGRQHAAAGLLALQTVEKFDGSIQDFHVADEGMSAGSRQLVDLLTEGGECSVACKAEQTTR